MAGTKTSGRKKGFTNPWSWQLHLGKKLAEAICQIKDEQGFKELGPSTYIVHDFFLKNEKRMRELLGSDYDQIFKDWSKTMDEQKEARRQKAISTYKFYGFSQEDAEKAYELEPDKEPLEVVRERNTVRQFEVKNNFLQAETTAMQDKHEDKATEKLLENPEYKALIQEKKDIESFFIHAQKEPNNPAYRKENVDKVTVELAETNRKLEAFLKPS
jgi:hypothetical protein